MHTEYDFIINILNYLKKIQMIKIKVTNNLEYNT